MTKPCAKCQKPTDLMAWRLLKVGKQDDEMYWVCHSCKTAVPFYGKRKTSAPAWVKHTEYHWQLRIDGELLDFWRGKKPKYRWRGKTYAGEPDLTQLRSAK